MTLALINTVRNVPLSPSYIYLKKYQLKKRLSKKNYDYQHKLRKFFKSTCIEYF